MLKYFADRQRHLICEPYSVTNLHHMAADMEIKRGWFHRGRHAHYDIPQHRIDDVLNDPRVTVITSKELLLKIRKG